MNKTSIALRTNMTEKEIDRIKSEWFDRGWRLGLLVGIALAVLAAIINSIVSGVA